MDDRDSFFFDVYRLLTTSKTMENEHATVKINDSNDVWYIIDSVQEYIISWNILGFTTDRESWSSITYFINSSVSIMSYDYQWIDQTILE